mmetsp:Transcript_15069/g.30514  ORF Transcript_15069/g.30514 Transcript_15069/m.30514 type:complete len:80 (-) Transcript_15069:2286-2525(-)
MAQPRSSLFCGVVIAGAAFVQCDGEIANETMPVIEFLGQILSVIQVVPTKFMKLNEFNGVVKMIISVCFLFLLLLVRFQ